MCVWKKKEEKLWRSFLQTVDTGDGSLRTVPRLETCTICFFGRLCRGFYNPYNTYLILAPCHIPFVNHTKNNGNAIIINFDICLNFIFLTILFTFIFIFESDIG